MCWIVIAWLIAALLCWAIVYGGTANDPNRYEEGDYDNGSKTEKEKFSNHDETV